MATFRARRRRTRRRYSRVSKSPSRERNEHAQARITTTPAAGTGPGQFISPHGIAVDSRGDLYIGEVCYTAWDSNFPDRPKPKRIRALQKFERVRAEAR